MKTLACVLLGLWTVGAASDSQSVYQFSAKNIDGKSVSMESFKGEVLLLVNVASKCGYTPQYSDLQKLYETYADKGFKVIGFPANNFMGQEPGTNEEIKSFCSANYGVTFPMMAKISVKGKDIHPLYAFLTDKEQNGVTDGSVKWNFQKYLINREGKVVAKFNPGVGPMDEELTDQIESLL